LIRGGWVGLARSIFVGSGGVTQEDSQLRAWRELV